MTTNFSASVSIFDTKNGRHLHFKSDGKRFGEERTIKISCDIKYDVTVAIKPAGVDKLALQRVTIGSDDITPDKVTQQHDRTEYSLVWFTNGYPPTKKGARNDLRIALKFADGELVFPVQVKFYPVSDTTHIVWGTIMKSIELESTGNFQPGASPHQRFPVKKFSFK